MSNSTFQITLFKLLVNGGGKDDKLNNLLKYDFRNATDYSGNPICLYDLYWRSLLYDASGKKFIDNTTYLAKYDNEITDLLNKFNSATYTFEGSTNASQGIDLTKYFDGFTLNLTLNSLSEAAMLEFRESDIKIEENNLIEIKENGTLIFLGFVSKVQNSLEYENFYTQKVTILNVGKMYSISKITFNPSLADYAIRGKDVKIPNQTIFEHIFSNKTTFAIMDFLMTYFFLSKQIPPTAPASNSFDFAYVLDPKKIDNLDTFNIIFPMIKSLELYMQKVNPDFTMLKIKNGNHKTYNQGVTQGLKNYKPQFKTASQVLDDTVKATLYDIFVDYDSSVVVRPPLYNYLPMGLDATNDPKYTKTGVVYNDNIGFNIASEFVIPRKNILNHIFTEDNTKLEIRTDALYTWPLYGEISEQIDKPQFFEDVPGLIKYGFRNEATKNNPNSLTNKMARVLAMFYNHQVNNSSRTLHISLKTDLDINHLTYHLGRLYYIDLPDVNLDEGIALQIDTSKNNTNSASIYGIVGYLINIKKDYKYDSYTVYDLEFSYIRNVQILNLANILNGGNEKNKILLEIYNITHPYGIVETMQLTNNQNISVQDYISQKTTELNNLEQQLKKYSTFPLFKTLPSIMDMIELTYGDSETKNTIVQNVNNSQPTTDTSSDGVQSDANYLYYGSYKVKMERFFRPSFSSGENIIQYNDPTENGTIKRASMFTSAVKDIINNNTNPQQWENNFNRFSKAVIASAGSSVSASAYNQSSGTFDSLESPIKNYQSVINTSFKFDLLNPQLKTSGLLALYQQGDNSTLSIFGTRFPKVLKGGIRLDNICQKLFNRIMEAEADIWDTWGQDMCEALFYDTVKWDDATPGIATTLSSDLVTQIIDDNISFEQGAGQTENTTSTLFNGLKMSVDKLPKGNFLNTKLTTGSVVWVDQINSGKLYNDSNLGVIGSDAIASQNAYYKELYDNDIFFSPAFLFNMLTIIQNNTLLTNPTTDDLLTLKKLGILENGSPLQSHKDGRAIDFFLPARDENGNGTATISGKQVPIMPFIYPNFLGTFNISTGTYDTFEKILKINFDTIIRTKNIINFDLNVLSGNSKVVTNAQPYAIYIYHVEVANRDFLDPITEFMDGANGIKSTKGQANF